MPKKGKSTNKNGGSSSNPAVAKLVPRAEARTLTDAQVFPDRNDRVFTVTKTAELLAGVTGNTGEPVYYAFTFDIGGFTELSSYQATFDEYRVNCVEVVFRPTVNQTTTATGVTGLLHTAIDFNDATVPTSVAQVNDYASCIVTEGYKEQRRCWVPTALAAAFDGSGDFTSGRVERRQWYPLSPDFGTEAPIEFYGLKIALTRTAQVFDITFRLSVSFRISK